MTFTPKHIDYLNAVVDEVDRLADAEPDMRVADLIDVAFGAVDPFDYVDELDEVDLSGEEYEYVKARIR